jgi:hypothetical protein
MLLQWFVLLYTSDNPNSIYCILIEWNICKDGYFYDELFTAKRNIDPFNFLLGTLQAFERLLIYMN